MTQQRDRNSWENEIKRINCVNMIFAILSLQFMILPIVKGYLAGGMYRNIMIFLIGGWSVTAFAMIPPKDRFRISSSKLPFLLIILFYIVLVLSGLGNIREQMVVIVFPYYSYVVYSFYRYKKMWNQMAWIGWAVFLAYIVTFMTTISALTVDSTITRNVRGVVNNNIYYRNNIGGIDFVYAAGMIFILLFIYLRSGVIQSKNMRLFLMGSCTLSLYIVLVGSSAITLVAVFISLFYELLQKIEKTRRILILCCLLVMSLLTSSVIADGLILLSKHIDNGIISKKMYDLALSFSSGKSIGSLAERTSRWNNDFSLGLSTFGLGCGPIYSGSGNGWSFSGIVYSVSDHSQLLGDFARYGVGFILLFVSAFLQLKKEYSQNASKLGINTSFDSLWLMIVIMYISQPIFIGFTIPIVVLFLVPASMMMIKKSNIEHIKLSKQKEKCIYKKPSNVKMAKCKD